MTLIELAEACKESIEFQQSIGGSMDAAIINLTIPRLCRNKQVEILPGCFGENLGHVPIGPEFGAGAKLNGTQVSVKVSAIREYIESQL